MQKTYPKILVTDEALRDGLQIEREGVTLEEKIEVLDLLVDAGIRRLMVGAFVSPKWSPQMADTPELVKALKPRPGVQFFALALNERGREMIRAHSDVISIDPTPITVRHMCHVFMQRNTNKTPEDQERLWRLPIEQATAAGVKKAGMALSEPWGSNWSGPTTHEARMETLQLQYDAWQEAGIEVTRVCLFDPMAWNQPHLVAKDLRAIKERWPSITEFHIHLHNARGLALLSIYEALSILDDRHTLIIDTALGGIGGCPYCGNGQATGMIPTEELVQLLLTLGVDIGIDLQKLIKANHRLSEILDRRLHSQVSLNGALPLKTDDLYDEDVPAIYTFEEAQHFRLGESVYEGNPRPWVRNK